MNIPDLYKEKLTLGELSDQEKSSPRLMEFTETERLLSRSRTERENADFLARHPWDSVKLPAKKTRRSIETTSLNKKTPGDKIRDALIRTVLLWGTAATACLVFGAILLFYPDSAAFRPAQALARNGEISGERVKGAATPRLFVYKKSAEYGAVLLNDRSIVLPHDVLQVSYVSGGSSYGAIISVDGNGVVTQHYPDEKLSSGPLEASGETLLDFSYELDAAPYFERFIFVSSNGRIPLERLGKALESAKDSEELLRLDPAKYVPDGCSVTEVVLLKGK